MTDRKANSLTWKRASWFSWPDLLAKTLVGEYRIEIFHPGMGGRIFMFFCPTGRSKQSLGVMNFSDASQEHDLVERAKSVCLSDFLNHRAKD